MAQLPSPEDGTLSNVDPGAVPEDPGTSLLRLLATDVPAEALTQVAREAELSGGETLNSDLLRTQVTLALRVRAVLDDHRRQARELGALFDTAGDLAALRDLTEVLRAICHRGKSLLGTSAAWINLTDRDYSDTYIHTTEGTQSPGGLRVPPGAGLAGLVAAAGTPQWTNDYINDDRLAHYALGDEWVIREGIRSALGVPLKRAGAVIGVIMAAERRTRQFSTEEIMLLQSLADHAAIAIENTRLFSGAQQALADLNDANRKVRAHSVAIEDSVTFHEQLTELVLEGADLNDVLRAVIRGLGGRLLVIDPEWRILARAGSHQDPLDNEIGDSEFLPQSESTQTLQDVISRPSRTALVVLEPTLSQRLVIPIPPHSQPVGLLVFTRSNISDNDQRMLERAALVVAVLVLNAQALSDSEQRDRDEFLKDLFAPATEDQSALGAKATALGVDLEQPYAVVVARRKVRPARSTRTRASQIAAEIGGLAGELGAELVFLLPRRNAEDAAHLVTHELHSRDFPQTVTAAGPVHGQLGLSSAYAEARQTQRVLSALGRSGTTATANQLGIYGLLLRNTNPGEATRFIELSIGPLLEHDGQHKGNLVDTLDAYFEHGERAAEAAAVMFVHVNTIYSRLDRVSRLLPSWQSPEERLQIHLALKIHQLAKRLGDPL